MSTHQSLSAWSSCLDSLGELKKLAYVSQLKFAVGSQKALNWDPLSVAINYRYSFSILVSAHVTYIEIPRGEILAW